MTISMKGQGARPVDTLESSFASIFGGALGSGMTASLMSALQRIRPELISEVAIVEEVVDAPDRSSTPRG